jgi:hypothetical protein
MRFDTRSTRIQILAIALAVGAAACAKNDAETTDNVAGGAIDTTPTATTPAAFKVSDVELGKSLNTDKTIKDNTDDFGVRDTIYASVKTEGSATGATLVARWTFQDGQVVEEQNQTINATGDAITEFHISKATAWPKGNYKLSILLNGTEVETEDFEIK